MLVDTGCQVTWVDKSTGIMAGVAMKQETDKLKGAGGVEVALYSGHVKDLVIGPDFKMTDLDIRFLDRKNGSGSAFCLGIGELEVHSAIIDFNSMIMYVRHP